MATLGSSPSKGGVSLGDIIFVLLIAMGWFFLVQVSSSFVVIAMSGLAWFMVTLYIISRFTGFLNYMKLLRPTWTISYLVSLPIWLLMFAILPVQKLPSAITEGATYFLDKIIPPPVMDWVVNSLFFAITESLLIVFLISLFIGVAMKNKGRLTKENKNGQLAAIFLVVGFASLLHTGVALNMADAGQFSFTVVLVHQLISFFIMVMLGMVFGAPGIIAPHMAKNDLVYASVGLWWISLLICIVMDIVSIFSSGGKVKKVVNEQLGFT